jgi:MerR family transcriptional regulator, light-induced transcriptional regulator
MNDTGLLAGFLTTRQAAGLLNVHESTVKRWCNAGDLAHSVTEGGHRRITVADFVAFARSRKLASHLLHFPGLEERIWQGISTAAASGDYSILAELMAEWMTGNETLLPVRLLDFLQAQEFALGDIFDLMMGPVMRQIGSYYAIGSMEIGEEHRMTQITRDLLLYVRYQRGMHLPSGRPGRVAIVGCSRNETHELGSLMARIMLEDYGWRVVYLGIDVPAEEFAAQQKRWAARLIAVSISPIRAIPESRALIKMLSTLGDPESPYDLVIGGSASLKDLAPEKVGKYPFRNLVKFQSMRAFAEWLEHYADE